MSVISRPLVSSCGSSTFVGGSRQFKILVVQELRTLRLKQLNIVRHRVPEQFIITFKFTPLKAARTPAEFSSRSLVRTRRRSVFIGFSFVSLTSLHVACFRCRQHRTPNSAVLPSQARALANNIDINAFRVLYIALVHSLGPISRKRHPIFGRKIVLVYCTAFNM